jgi:peptidoglycan/xylan/chitin deacetylase (PgdA/CDA1 family)
MFLENYKEIPVAKSVYLRNIIRGGIIKTLSFFQSNSKTNCGIQFLYFHHVFKDEMPYLDKCIVELTKTYKFISYSDAVRKIKTNSIDSLYLCFSSDDGFKNNLNSLRIFEKYQISACFFLNPDFIGENSYEKLKLITSEVFHLGAKPIEFLNWNDVELLLKNNHEIGSHTMTHKRLSALSDSEQEFEIFESKKNIESRIGQVSHFAFPYGTSKDINFRSLELVKKAKYESCANASRGFHVNEFLPDMPIINRDPIIFKNYKEQLEYFNKKNLSIPFS